MSQNLPERIITDLVTRPGYIDVKHKLEDYLAYCKSYQVTSAPKAEDLAGSMADSKSLVAGVKKVEAAAKEEWGPLEKEIKKQKSLIKDLYALEKEANRIAGQKMVRFRTEQEKKRKAKEAAEWARQRELRRKAEEEMKKAEESLVAAEDEASVETATEALEQAQAKIEEAEVAIPSKPNEKMIRSEGGGGVTFRKDPKFEVLDPAAVPAKYCSPDNKKIRAAIKSGIRKIDGVRIWVEEVPITRRSQF